MKSNPDKCHLITSSSDEVSMYVESKSIESTKCKKLLGIKNGNKLTLWHISEKFSLVKF